MNLHGASGPDAPLVQAEARRYDAVLVVSYGGPEGPDDVMPFLENATRGRRIPRDRLLEVAEHYRHFGGVSPINAQNRALVKALTTELETGGPALQVYLGNRNWHPYLEDTIRSMRDAGVRHALALVTSAFSCYSGCRQYREDILRACEIIGDDAPTFDKVRVFFNHPGFVEANTERLRESLALLEAGRRDGAHVVFTAHSIPASMARHSAYEAQLREASRLVAERAEIIRWSLAYQSRSGPPQVPWLEPDIGDHLERLAASGTTDVVLVPIGFLSDHMEVLYDLDQEAHAHARALGLGFVRAPSVGTHPSFIHALRELIVERMTDRPERRALGTLGPGHDVCPIDCCLEGRPSGSLKVEV